MTWTPDDVKKIDQIETPNYLNVLPDSRTNGEPKGIVSGWHPTSGRIDWQPIFCANCGKPDGYVPTENMDFAFALCPDCAERLGPIAGTWVCPDEVYWKRVEHYQIEKYGRVLRKPELLKLLESGDDRQLMLLIRSKKSIARGDV